MSKKDIITQTILTNPLWSSIASQAPRGFSAIADGDFVPGGINSLQKLTANDNQATQLMRIV